MDDRLGEGALRDLLRRALSDARVADADAYVRRTRAGFARYALNALGQHGEMLEEHGTSPARFSASANAPRRTISPPLSTRSNTAA